MTASAVQTLAERPCPGLTEGTPEHSWHVDYDPKLWPDGLASHCPTCNGTGALVPGLRRECPYPLLHKAAKGHLEDDGGRRLTPWWTDEDCQGCQGRGWVLVPEREQRAAMEDWCLARGWILLIEAEGVSLYQVQQQNGSELREGLFLARSDYPETTEAVAQAALEALEA